MKKILRITFLLLATIHVNAQEKKVEIVQTSNDVLYDVSKTLEGKMACCCIGYTVHMNYEKKPFKTYIVENENWILQQDAYNTLRAKVPGISIINEAIGNTNPVIRMRGDDNTIVIVDGVRFDSSILNTINPADIESITVTNSFAAQNYYRANRF